MNNRVITIAIVLFVLIIVGMFVFAYIKSREIEQGAVPPTQEQPVAGPYDHIVRIDAKHFFVDDTHTIVGEILMPTPCDLLNWDTAVMESYPEQVTVNFGVINNAESCAQMVTAQRFKVSFKASEQASIRATLQGRPVELNLIPAAEGETPDDFELFIKG